MIQGTIRNKISRYFFSYSPELDEQQRKLRSMFTMLSLYAFCYLIIAIALNLTASLSSAAIINLCCLILISAFYIFRHLFRSVANAALSSCGTIFITLLIHQLLLQRLALHNYIWLMAFPMLFVHLFSYRTNVVFTTIIILSIVMGNFASPYIAENIRYQLSTENIFFAATRRCSSGK